MQRLGIDQYNVGDTIRITNHDNAGEILNGKIATVTGHSHWRGEPIITADCGGGETLLFAHEIELVSRGMAGQQKIALEEYITQLSTT
jgi:hypothetical protein